MEAVKELVRPALEIPFVPTLLGLTLLLGGAWFINWALRTTLRRVVSHLVRRNSRVRWDDILIHNSVIKRAVNVVPALMVHRGIGGVPGLPASLVGVVEDVSLSMVVIAVAASASNLINALNEFYVRTAARAKERPIKGFLQVIQLVIWVAAVLLVISTLINKSPVLLLSGLGAMTAVTMLVFQDTILSLVASVQLSGQDMLRVGDWVEMPSQNADGEVIDIALNVVKVQNWDKTISTIPTHRFISQSFKNWRGMQQSGGRRIKRSLLIDQTSVRFLSNDERDSLRRLALIDDYLNAKKHELEAWNKTLLEAGKDPINTRRVTNLGTFRAYVGAYLKANPRINQEMSQMVRQLAPDSTGIPMEVYCFTATVSWVPYEETQADLFDHLLAMLPVFGLRLHQAPTGQDLMAALRQLVPTPASAPPPITSVESLPRNVARGEPDPL